MARDISPLRLTLPPTLPALGFPNHTSQALTPALVYSSFRHAGARTFPVGTISPPHPDIFPSDMTGLCSAPLAQRSPAAAPLPGAVAFPTQILPKSARNLQHLLRASPQPIYEVPRAPCDCDLSQRRWPRLLGKPAAPLAGALPRSAWGTVPSAYSHTRYGSEQGSRDVERLALPFAKSTLALGLAASDVYIFVSSQLLCLAKRSVCSSQ